MKMLRTIGPMHGNNRGMPDLQVRKPDERDVLLGRGSGSNEHPGNVAFRRKVEARKAEYNEASKRKMKRHIAQVIIDETIAHGGRFLKKNAEEEQHFWILAGKEAVFEKVLQALRQKPKKKHRPGEEAFASTVVANTPEKAQAHEERKEKAGNSNDASPRRKKAPRIENQNEIQANKEIDAYAGLPRERLLNILKRKDATIDELLEQLKKKDSTIATLLSATENTNGST